MNAELTDVIIDIIRILVINIGIYYMDYKLINLKANMKFQKIIITIIGIIFVTIIGNIIKEIMGFLYSIIVIVFLESILFSKNTNNTYPYSLLVTIISSSINYIMFSIAIILSYMFISIIKIYDMHINFAAIILFYTIFVYSFFKIRKFRYGFIFLQKNFKNEYFDMVILNISLIIMFLLILMSNYNELKSRGNMIALIMLIIFMCIIVQKSLQLYYKQKMLVKDLEETKKELEDKKAEVKELEKENLNFSKISHTIAHRQKSLEHKLEELNMNNEISNELGARIQDVTKDLKKETAVELSKTGIEVIDDMLSYMQSECIKNKIDFQLQINGNIYTMTNHYIGKDELEILLADHIKNAIIAIGYTDSVNKSILVRLGKIDGNYGLYVYDSGIEFEIDTLMNLGIKPSTTHKDNGGTGMGFMNTFDTLRKYKASLEIEEIGKPCKDNFTKVLKFKFDNKEEFKIKSYRKDEIKKKDKENKLNLI